VKISGSNISRIICDIFARSSSILNLPDLGGSFFSFSMVLTKFGDTPASPIRRSTASGGHVDMRRVGRISGFVLSLSADKSERKFVVRKEEITASVVRTLVSRNALGANRINQELYISTEDAISDFHWVGLSAFIAKFISPFPNTGGMIELEIVAVC
jgi:hypothetical protein